jgi:hypothetical protein
MTAITGAFREYSVATTTAGTTASPYMFKQGYAFGTVTNPSSASRTIAYYGVTRTSTGDAGPYAVYDEDGVAVTQTVGVETMHAVPSACAGVPILIAVTAAAASTKNLLYHFER